MLAIAGAGRASVDPAWISGPPCDVPDRGLHESVARIARTDPEAVALVQDGQSLRYGKLDRDADAWAAELAAQGIGPGSIVPIVLPRGITLVTALLAVLKTGAAYALLDPAWPDERLRAAVRVLGAWLVVAAPGAACSGTVVWVPTTGAATPAVCRRATFRPARTRADDPCCAFFTSGTTGEPKAVLSPHGATARLFQADSFAPFGPSTVIPLASAVPWDAFALELWAALLSGGTAVVVDEPYLSAAALRDGIAAHGVNTAWLTSTLFTVLVDEDIAAFEGLTTLMVGGERLSPAHVDAFLRHHPATTLLNGYGPVESTVFATTHRVTSDDVARSGGIPLGRAVPGTAVAVLDGDRPCAAGELGEVCIAGAGLASGYVGDPATTAAKFVHLPTGGPGGSPGPVYRTGDLGVLDDDGVLHYRGRADRQVKIRGHRVEPAEVERQVERLLPGVRDCRVVVRPAAAGTPSELVAFCVPAVSGDPLPGSAARLRDGLAAYQRPAAVVSVPAFPMTARGKLDERALLDRVPTRSAPAAEIPAPADPMTRLVAEVFAEVLGGPPVPADIPFLELGGSSLGSGRVCARLAARLGRPVPVAGLYRHPTAAGLARLLTRAPDPAAIRVVDPDDGVPLTPLQLTYLTRQLVDPDDRTGHCLLLWTVTGTLDLDALQAAVDAVHLRHDPLSAVYLPDPVPAAWLDDIPAPDVTRLAARPSADEAVRAVRAVLAEGLDPLKGDVWRVATAPVSPPVSGPGSTPDTPAVAVVGCVVHHIAFDGWSESVLARDLSVAYAAARGRADRATVADRPHPPSLAEAAPPPVDPLALGEQRDLLRAELAAVPPVPWPARGPTAARDADGPRELVARLSPAAVAAVDDTARSAGVTRFTVLITRWGQALAATTGADDFAVGVPVARRDRPDLEHAVGCHLTMFCLRMRDAALDSATPAAYRAVADRLVHAFAAQDVPFPEVLGMAEPAPGRPPLFQALFALQDNEEPVLDLEGAQVAFRRLPYLDLPLELHTELWPLSDGGLRVAVTFRPDAVAPAVAEELLRRYVAAVLPNGDLP